ncbi:MAG: hypothetical protein ABH828_06320 [archaeon]
MKFIYLKHMGPGEEPVYKNGNEIDPKDELLKRKTVDSLIGAEVYVKLDGEVKVPENLDKTVIYTIEDIKADVEPFNEQVSMSNIIKIPSTAKNFMIQLKGVDGLYAPDIFRKPQHKI